VGWSSPNDRDVCRWCRVNTEDYIAETALRAKEFLFYKNGKPKGYDHNLALFTLHKVLRAWPADVSPNAQCFEWMGSYNYYDAGIAELTLHDARRGDSLSDQVLCNAAAGILSATKGSRLLVPRRGTSQGASSGPILHVNSGSLFFRCAQIPRRFRR
jgi:hypothetical protein